MSLNEFINKRRKELNMSIDDLVAESGIPKGTLSKITAGINTNPTLSTVETLCKALKCSINDAVGFVSESDSFTFDEQKMIKKYRSLDPYGQKAVTSVLDIEFERCLEANQKKIQHTRLIDFIDIPVSAGIGTYLDDERREQKEIIDSDLADRADFILRIDGDSMEPKYHSGEYVFVKKQDAVDLGQICIYYVDGKGYMKKYGGDRLISLNSKYDDILFSQYDIDEISCFGLVLGEAEVVE